MPLNESGFNSPFGILFVRTKSMRATIPTQFYSFNSPFGILFVRTEGQPWPGWPRSGWVSIPHSEFCSFGPMKPIAKRTSWYGFNSPFGILFVRTSTWPTPPIGVGTFQFPIRNSVRSDWDYPYSTYPAIYVSIPHSEFCSFGLTQDVEDMQVIEVGFNSPFGILFVRTDG